MARRSKKLQIRNTFYILTNGKETEKNYFDLIKSNKSIYDVKIEYHNLSSLQLVKYGLTIPNANQIWCVFDIDNTMEENILIPTINLAKKNNINIAFSNKAFEVWLLSHYNKIQKSMDNNKLILEMNKLLKKLNINKNYDKADKELLKKYFIPNLKTAINNSKIIHQKFIAEHEKNNSFSDYKIWEWNPCCNVYQLIEALKLEKI